MGENAKEHMTTTVQRTEPWIVNQGRGSKPRILLIDDEAPIARILSRLLRDYEIVHVSSAGEGLTLLAREDFPVIFCDLLLPGLDGIELHGIVERELAPLQDRFIFLTGGSATNRAREFFQRVHNRCIDKPFSSAEIREAVAEAVGIYAPRAEAR
jgi:CheY-like chemotaxis protein